MLPNFLVIGAQKSGSSWFSECLGDHPEIFVVPHEVYFFNTHFDRGTAWYEALFEGRSLEPFAGEGTPGYIYHPEAPARIRATLGPDVKLIGCLRNPVDRAYSAYWNYLMWGRIPAGTDFRKYLFEKNPFDLRERGFYHAQLERYLEHFDRGQLLLFVQEEDLRRGAETARRCYEFLGADASFVPPRVDDKVNKTHDSRAGGAAVESLGVRVSRLTRSLPSALREPLRLGYEQMFKLLPKKQAYQPLDPEVRRDLLAEVYLDDIRRLEDLLGRDLSIWTHTEA